MQRFVTMLASVALLAAAAGLAAAGSPVSQDETVKSAMSAGPSSISADATIMDWSFNVIRKGTNGWTCLPDRADTEGPDPWCVNEPWMNFLRAYVNKTEPTYTEVGLAYMLQGDSPVSNTDPYATQPTAGGDWVTGLGAHMMILFPDRKALKAFPTDPHNGGPWVMWPDTPYAHLMVPIDAYGGGGHSAHH